MKSKKEIRREIIRKVDDFMLALGRYLLLKELFSLKIPDEEIEEIMEGT